MLISVVAPVFRECDNLALLHERVVDALRVTGHAIELILVDDHSDDLSWSAIKRLVAEDPRTVGICLPRHVGQHATVLVGLMHARGAWCVSLDSDLQDPPEAIAALLDAATGSDEVVFAGRFGTYQSFGRLLTGRAYRFVLCVLTGVPRDAGMFFALRRSALPKLLSLPVGTPSLVAMIGLGGLKARSIKVERARRTRGHGAYSWATRIAAGLRMLRCVFEAHWPNGRPPVRLLVGDTTLGAAVLDRRDSPSGRAMRAKRWYRERKAS